MPATAQNYYPADVGNEWVMESTDGKEKRTYTLEIPEDTADQQYILLKIVTEDFAKNEVDIDRYFVTSDDEGIKLHKTVFTIGQFAPLGDIVANFSPPVIFFRNVLSEGDKWKIVADAKISTIQLESITNLEIVGYEDVETPTGTFHFCAKVKLQVSTTGLIDIAPTTSYQWLAPDVGPIKYENSQGLVYELVSYNLQTDTQETQSTTNENGVTDPENISDNQSSITDPMTDDSEMTTETQEDETEDDKEAKNPYDITDDGVVNILDLVRMASHFGEENAEVDVTGDGIVNILDLVAIAQNFSS